MVVQLLVLLFARIIYVNARFRSVVDPIEAVGGTYSVPQSPSGPEKVFIGTFYTGPLSSEEIESVISAQNKNRGLRYLDLDGQHITARSLRPLNDCSVERVSVIGCAMDDAAATALLTTRSLRTINCDPDLEPLLRSAAAALGRPIEIHVYSVDSVYGTHPDSP